VLIITNQLTVWISRERGLSGAGEAEKECDVASLKAGIGG